MSVYVTNQIASLLAANSYGGRGIIIGKTPNAKNAVVAYFIMGRSENSRNRIFREEGEEVIIEAYDPSKLKDPSLVIYSPIRKLSIGCDRKQNEAFESADKCVSERNHSIDTSNGMRDLLIVTNGDQTDTIYEYLQKGKSFEEALRTRCFEPDAPNFTPRISGLLEFMDVTKTCKSEINESTDNEKMSGFTYKMSILKSADALGSACNRYTFDYVPLAGLGHYLHTYNCDGDPIPTFTGEPERIETVNDIDEFANDIWQNLNEQNKISLYVRYIDLETGAVQNRMFNKNIK